MFVRKLVRPALLAAALATAVATATTAAKADVDVFLGLGGGPGFGGHGHGYGPGPDFGPGYYDDPGFYRPYYRFRISCWEGRDSVREAGFRNVRAIDCNGSRYSYEARRRGDSFIVSVNSRSGRIVSVREIY